MKKLLRFSTFLFVVFASVASTKAQKAYKSAIGLRLGSPTSISFKTFASESLAFEAYFGTRGYSYYRWNNISAALQIHKPFTLIEEVEGLKYYVGVGASAYIISSYDGIFDNNWNSATFGVQGYAGFEYTFEDLPINLTIDWVPTYFLGEGFITGFRANYGTLGVRYVLGRGN